MNALRSRWLKSIYSCSRITRRAASTVDCTMKSVTVRPRARPREQRLGLRGDPRRYPLRFGYSVFCQCHTCSSDAFTVRLLYKHFEYLQFPYSDLFDEMFGSLTFAYIPSEWHVIVCDVLRRSRVVFRGCRCSGWRWSGWSDGDGVGRPSIECRLGIEVWLIFLPRLPRPRSVTRRTTIWTGSNA